MPKIYYQKMDNIAYVECNSLHTHETIVFFHGYMGSAYHHFRYQINYFYQLGYRVIAVDLPGFGRSSKSGALRRINTIQSLKEIEHFIQKKLNNSQFHLVGFSLGAYYALKLSIIHPDWIASLSILNGYAIEVPIIYRPPITVPPKLFSLTDKIIHQRTPKNIYWKYIKRLIKQNKKFLLRKLSKELPNRQRKHFDVLVIHSNLDTVVPPIGTFHVLKVFPHAKVVRLDTDHGVSHEVPTLTNSTLKEFIKSKKFAIPIN